MRGSFSPPEIIYVDSASVDGSSEIARRLGAKVIISNGPGLNAAKGRNAGWRAVSSEDVLFLDGDTVLDPGFAEKAKGALRAPEVAAVWGNRREMFPRKNFFHRVCDLDWTYPYGESEYFGGDVLIRRKVLEEVGGYDESLKAGEEPEMCGRIRAKGYKIFHIDVPMTLHDIRMNSWREYWRRAMRSGYAYAEVTSRFPQSAPPSWKRKPRHNICKAFLFAGLLLTGTGGLFCYQSVLPLCFVALFFLAVVLRNSFRNRLKTKDLHTLFAYGVHSCLAMFPLAWGQLGYLWSKQIRGGDKKE